MLGRIIFALAAAVSLALPLSAQPVNVQAEGHDARIDITWELPAGATADATFFNVYRAADAGGPFERVNADPHPFTVYSDFLGENDQTRHYRVTIVGETAGGDARPTLRVDRRAGDPGSPGRAGDPGYLDADGAQHVTRESPPSAVVSAATRKMSRDELLTSIQKATFRYFWDFGHPVSGLAREGIKHPRDTCTAGGTGFGLMTLMVGAERGFVTRAQAAERVLKIVRFLDEVTPRYHGVWSHWIHGATGETIPFSGKEDNGGDIVETAFLVQGLLTVAEYFDGSAPAEREIRERVERMWRGVEWDWHLGGEPGNKRLIWHWSPDYGFKKNHRIGGHFNECMIAYLLGIASPTHPLPPETYYEGWVHNPAEYANGKEFFGVSQPVGWDMGGPLFFTQYSFIGMDPRAITDRFCNYFENNRAISLINHAYCVANPKEFAGYSDLVWGLTASFSVKGYKAHEPREDNGTITPTAALSAMPYVPEKSLPTMEHFYRELGDRVWGPFGFRDAFNVGEEWVSDTYLAIDQGPIAPMIENYRTQLCWRMFMRNDDVRSGLRRAGVLDPGYAKKSAAQRIDADESLADAAFIGRTRYENACKNPSRLGTIDRGSHFKKPWVLARLGGGK